MDGSPPPTTPAIRISPAAIDVTLPTGQSTTVALTVANAGGAQLTFAIAKQTASAQSVQAASVTKLDAPAGKIDPALAAVLQTDGQARFFIYLAEQADLSAAAANPDWQAQGQQVYDELRATAQRTQADLLRYLGEQQAANAAADIQSFFIVNTVAVSGGPELAGALAARPDVAYLALTQNFILPPPQEGQEVAAAAVNGVEWGVDKIDADRVWNELGLDGAGVVVANIDTGVDADHPALRNQYRGNQSGSHDFNWYDPSGQHTSAPGDNNGHGTHVMGTILGSDGGANRIGVAPGARWIAAKGCASDSCSDDHLLAAAQWMLAPCPIGVQPGSNACDPAKRPRVVNNSWGGGGGNPWYLSYVNAWRAAGIFPAFAAGNKGAAGSGTVSSPGDYASSFAVGATDSGDQIAGFSGRGPSRLTPETKPDVSAPGVNVRSALPGGDYGEKSGTSMATPHLAGVVALLLQANPALSVDELEALLVSTATDLGAPGPDLDYGYGRIDAFQAVQASQNTLPWLSYSPANGAVAPGQNAVIAVTLDAAGLTAGEHQANLVISSNDPAAPTVVVPVTLVVAQSAAHISDIRISNLNDKSATITWITNVPARGEVRYSTNPNNLVNVAYDRRGEATSDDVHYVTLDSLAPQTTYYFQVVSGDSVDDNHGAQHFFKTGATLGITPLDPAYGQVFKSNGQLAANVLVYLQVRDANGQDSVGESALLSALTNEEGYWSGPTNEAVNLGAVRSQNGAGYFIYSANGGDQVRAEIHGAADCNGMDQFDTGAKAPAPSIQLSCLQMAHVELQNGWTVVNFAAPLAVSTANGLMQAAEQQGGNVRELFSWNAALGQWRSKIKGAPFGDFDIFPGAPVFIRSSQRHLLSLPLGNGVGNNDAIALTSGWNFIALPVTAPSLTAEQACGQIAAQGGAVSEIARWQSDNWAGHPCGLPFGDFALRHDQGYFIKSSKASQWTPAQPATGLGVEPLQGNAEMQAVGASHPAISRVEVVNVTASSATFLWWNDAPGVGGVRFGSIGGELVNEVVDEAGVRRLHFVTLSGLQPQTTYAAAVWSGETVDDAGGARYYFTTGPVHAIPGLHTVYGRARYADGNPAAGHIIRLTLVDADGIGSSGAAAALVTVSDNQGYWTLNLGGARTVNSETFEFSDADRVSIEISSADAPGVVMERSVAELSGLIELSVSDSAAAGWRYYLPIIADQP